ncbi:thioredoxin family protein [Bacillus sp. FJAT-42376]|uniref:thioredoxin family protein n=1 Tax=Bacillus sp. FJAT-42376 TaxID=2014076 RepID=UPI000F500739|nr:thioredoxin family protein [Bacillus sp. FJAT-42376]AZB44737.1 thioredoxin family protein [Bacillus sp. FJAT-42376]
MMLNEWFEKGWTKETYISRMNVHQENLLHIYNSFQMKEEDRVFLQTLQKENLRAIVLTADWCGDAMVNLPILMRLSEEALIETRYLIRDENLELMDQYLTNGTARSIPIIIFTNENGEEVAKWGPRTAAVQEWVDEQKQSLPEKDAPEFKEAFAVFAETVAKRFTSDTDFWNQIKDDLIETIKNRIQ